MSHMGELKTGKSQIMFDAQINHVVELFHCPPQVALSVAVGILEAGNKDLADNCTLPPRRIQPDLGPETGRSNNQCHLPADVHWAGPTSH